MAIRGSLGGHRGAGNEEIDQHQQGNGCHGLHAVAGTPQLRRTGACACPEVPLCSSTLSVGFRCRRHRSVGWR